MYSAWKLNQLKEELKRRGASVGGRKADLIERLECYDRNFNFGNEEFPEDDDPGMSLPPAELYRDVNSNTNLPPINKTQIRHYLNYTEKKMQKIIDLYESRHLVAVRAQTVNNFTFIKGISRKTMKSLHYEMNLKLDEYGNIEETHCECPAGSGINASCKHVAVLLLGLENVVTKKCILLFETCTQRLQQFHAPRNPYSGTPVRAEKMPRKRKSHTVLFEPYPLSNINRQNYNARIRNLVLNYQNSSMSMKQMFEPANPYALVNDHKYTTTIPEYKVLQDLHLINITQEEIQLTEELTRGQKSSAEWQIQRKKRLTASKFHTICHLKPTTAPSYAKQLLQQKPFTSRATTHGILNEPIALEKYCQQYDLTAESCGLFISQEKPFIAATPDALLGPDTVIEIKCPYASRFQSINSVTVPYLTPDLCLKTTSPYYYQVQGQMYCTGRKFCNLIVYTYKDMKVVYITRDEAFIQNMVTKLEIFYENYFKKDLLNKFLYKNYDKLEKNRV